MIIKTSKMGSANYRYQQIEIVIMSDNLIDYGGWEAGSRMFFLIFIFLVSVIFCSLILTIWYYYMFTSSIIPISLDYK